MLDIVEWLTEPANLKIKADRKESIEFCMHVYLIVED